MAERLQGKVAIVTGGARGIGAACARALAAEGASVAVSYSASAEAAEALAAELTGGGGKAEAFKADHGRPGEAARLVEAVVAAFGRLDVVVNNAGTFVMGEAGGLTDADYAKVFDLNVRGVFEMVRAATPHLTEGGRIITIGSVNGDRVPMSGGAAYAATKAAVAGATRGWARDLGPKGITVNAVQPGPIDTDMNPASGDFAAVLMPHLAIPRYGRPEEVGAAVAFLASPQASYITGTTLNVDGGFNA